MSSANIRVVPAVRRLSLRILVGLIAAGVAGTSIPTPADAQFNGLRTQTRTLNRAISNQVREALRPRLVIRSGPLEAVTSLTAPVRQRYLTATASDGSVRLWDLNNGSEILQARPPVAPVTAAATDDGAHVVVVGGDGSAHMLRRTFGESFEPLALVGATAVAALPGGRLVIGTGSGDLHLIDRMGNMQSAGRVAEPVSALSGGDGGLLVGGAGGGVWQMEPAGGAMVVRDQWRLDGAVRAVDQRRQVMLAGTEAGVVSRLAPGGGTSWTLDAGAPAKAVSVAAVGPAAVVAGDRVLLVDSGTGALLPPFADPVEAPTGVASNALGRVLVSGAGGRIALFDGLTGQRLATMYSTKESWAAIDAQGRYDGTAHSARDVAWDLDGRLLDLRAFAEEWFEPGLIAKYLVGAEAALMTRPPAAPDEGFREPPEVEISSDGMAAADVARVRVEASIRGKPADDETPSVRVQRNGRVIDAALVSGPEVQAADRTRWIWTAEVPLVAGANTLRATVSGWGGIEAESPDLGMSLPDARSAGAFVISGVGINDYASPDLRLNYAVADANAVVDAFISESGLSVDDRIRYLHLDREATKATLAEHFASLRDTSPDDVVMLFLSGHARTVGDEWYFLPSESVSLRQDAHVREVGISATDLSEALSRVPASRLVVIIDACQSGAAIGAFENFAQRRAVTGLARTTGVTIMAATRADQLAPEYEALGHGIFTYTLLFGLKEDGKGGYVADQWPRDGTVMMGELRTFVETTMPVLAAEMEKQMEPQMERGALSDRAPVTPALTDVSADFPVR